MHSTQVTAGSKRARSVVDSHSFSTFTGHDDSTGSRIQLVVAVFVGNTDTDYRPGGFVAYDDLGGSFFVPEPAWGLDFVRGSRDRVSSHDSRW